MFFLVAALLPLKYPICSDWSLLTTREQLYPIISYTPNYLRGKKSRICVKKSEN